MTSEFSKWYSYLSENSTSIKGLLESAYKLLDMNFIRKMLLEISESMEVIKDFLKFLSSISFEAIQSLISPSSKDKSETSKIADNLKKAVASGRIFDLFKNFLYIVQDNGSSVKQLNSRQMESIFKSAVKDIDKFVSTVKTLKESNSGNSEGKWGKYKDGTDLTNALLDNSWTNLFLRWAHIPASFILEDCDTCREEDTLSDVFKLFKSVFTGTYTSRKGK